MVITIGMLLLLICYVLSSNNRFKPDLNHKVLGIKVKIIGRKAIKNNWVLKLWRGFTQVCLRSYAEPTHG